MKCSIVIATYNKADALEMSLRSIRQQSPQHDYEIVVVDDGSSDRTAEVCRKFHTRYAYLDRPYYCNPAKARNLGLRMARGEVVIQQCEVIHHSPNAIDTLVNALSPGTFAIASTWDAVIAPGEPSPIDQPFIEIQRAGAYSGPLNPRPFFFLGAAYRDDLLAIGGYDEDFVYPGFDDNWHADCLIRGRGLRAIQLPEVQGLHLSHSRPAWISAAHDQMHGLYNTKVSRGIFSANTSCLRRPPSPRISIACLIYRSTEMADAVANSIDEFTSLVHTGEAEFFFVANNATPAVKSHLRAAAYNHYSVDHKPMSEEDLFAQGYAAPEYINRVYRGWNEAIRRSRGELVVLINSDHFFSPQWLENLLKHADLRRIVTSQLVERIHPKYGVFPGAHQQDFGDSVKSFRKSDWLAYCPTVADARTRQGGAYMPCLFFKSMAERVGLYPEGNICGNSFHDVHLYGDQAFFAKLGTQRVDHITAMDSLVYHLKEGEMEC